MAVEHEIKLPVADLDPVRERLASEGACCLQPKLGEENWVFDDADGHLAAAGKLLRVRRWGGEIVLTFKGPARFSDGVKSRQELETTVGDLGTLKEILAALGFKPVRRYQKRRELWRLKGITVALDETPLGSFVELEGEVARLGELATSLGLDPATAVRGTYLDLWTAHRAAHPEAPADMVFP